MSLGKDAPMIVDANGGRQSKTVGRFDLVPGEAVIRIAQVCELGEHHGHNNWRRIAYESQINHALQHLMALLADDTSDDHLGHALTRLAYAVAVEKKGFKFTAITDEISQDKKVSEKFPDQNLAPKSGTCNCPCLFRTPKLCNGYCKLTAGHDSNDHICENNHGWSCVHD